ncbi:MAG TPA: CoA transferase [Candidatus Binatia bacterium]|jgi:crotonobetainyl-CoA:carnitine CoA-transferase CaiB-like acyl-CoA transferase|nr:CoA transferase [Candidatus Binatia bacterium]
MTDVMKGIRVLEVAEHTFVPAASAVLSDWGADVVKVEHPERGDAMRGLGRTGVMKLSSSVHVLSEHSNRGKRSIGIDLTHPDGLEVLYALVRRSDVFLTNKLPGILARLRIDVADIRAVNSKIIYVRGTAFGVRGPDRDRGGYDQTAFWCRAGNAASVTPAELPGILPQPGPAWGDSMGGMTIAGGIAAALLKRERTGEPSVVDVSLLATGMWALSAGIALSRQSKTAWSTPMPGGTASFNPLVATYETSDRRFVSLVMLQAFHYWPDFCAHIDRPELAQDPRFDSVEHLAANGSAAVEILRDVFKGRTLVEWTERFQTLRGQWAPVQNAIEVADDPQARANGYVTRATTRDGTDFELVATPVQFDEQPTPTRRGPELNEHGDDILQELGMDMDRIIALRVSGAVA